VTEAAAVGLDLRLREFEGELWHSAQASLTVDGFDLHSASLRPSRLDLGLLAHFVLPIFVGQ
jgi:hypothetical protein